MHKNFSSLDAGGPGVFSGVPGAPNITIDCGRRFFWIFGMARLARVVAAGMPHHGTQRGNRRQATFFCDHDYQAYLDLMAEWCGEHNIEGCAYRSGPTA